MDLVQLTATYTGEVDIEPVAPTVGMSTEGKSDMICGDCDCKD